MSVEGHSRILDEREGQSEETFRSNISRTWGLWFWMGLICQSNIWVKEELGIRIPSYEPEFKSSPITYELSQLENDLTPLSLSAHTCEVVIMPAYSSWDSWRSTMG